MLKPTLQATAKTVLKPPLQKLAVYRNSLVRSAPPRARVTHTPRHLDADDRPVLQNRPARRQNRAKTINRRARRQNRAKTVRRPRRKRYGSSQNHYLTILRGPGRRCPAPPRVDRPRLPDIQGTRSMTRSFHVDGGADRARSLLSDGASVTALPRHNKSGGVVGRGRWEGEWGGWRGAKFPVK